MQFGPSPDINDSSIWPLDYGHICIERRVAMSTFIQVESARAREGAGPGRAAADLLQLSKLSLVSDVNDCRGLSISVSVTETH